MSFSIIELENSDFKDFINQEKVLIEFFAEWCGPCKIVLPVLEKLSKETKEVKFAKINIEECAEVCSNLAIKSVPTIVYFENGKEVRRNTGSLNEMKIKEMYV